MRGIIRTVSITILIFAVTLLEAGSLSAKVLVCNNNPDFFSKKCTVHPYSVTKVVAGNVTRGHLIGCQFKSYTCINGICRDNFGTMQIPYSHGMDDLPGFCALLCRTPECQDPQGWQ